MKRYGWLLLAALGLTGCATVPLPPVPADAQQAWQRHEARLLPVDVWDIRGRLALRADDKGWQATLHWVRDRTRHRIDLLGPFGHGYVRLTQSDHRAELQDDGRHTYYADNAEALLYRMTGWRLPLDGLNYWVLGVPVPNVPSEERLDAWGRLQTLTQLGWNIHYLDYAEDHGYELPRKVFLTRQDGPGREDQILEVRLFIEHWGLKP